MYPYARVELWLGEWVDITADVYLPGLITITGGRANEAARVSPGRCRFRLRNIDGRYSPRNAAGPYYGLLVRNTPVRVSVIPTPDGTGPRNYRFTGEVTALPQAWHASGNDAWVNIEAYGLLLRLGTGSPPARDAMRRFVASRPVAPLSYWPFDEGTDGREGGEIAVGGQPLRSLGQWSSYYQRQVEWGSGSLAPWLDSVAQLPQREGGGVIVGRVNLADTTTWAFDHVRSGRGTGENLFLEDSGQGTTASPQVRWQIEADAPDGVIRLWINVLTSTGEVETLVATVAVAEMYDEAPHHIRFAVTPDGSGGTDWELWVDGALEASGTRSEATRSLLSVSYDWSYGGSGTSTTAVALGHLIYWGADAPEAAAVHRAANGYQSELAGRRVERLCQEDGVALRVHGDLDETQAMGPQRPGALLGLLAAAEQVDGGTLGEARDVLALEYRTGRSRYNQGVGA